MQTLLSRQVEFGIHKGKLVKDVPASYYDWLLRNVPGKPIEPWHFTAIDMMAIYTAINDKTTCLILIEFDSRESVIVEEIMAMTELCKKILEILYHSEKSRLKCLKKVAFKQEVKKSKSYHEVASSMELKLQDLGWLNHVLIATGHYKAKTVSEAVHAIKGKVFINIFDLEEGRYDMAFDNYQDLRENMRMRGMFFPLSIAKSYPHLRIFLH